MAITNVYPSAIDMVRQNNFGVFNVYKVNLYTAATFNPAHNDDGAVDAASTAVPNGNGYTHFAKTLEVTGWVTEPNGTQRFQCSPVAWPATGAGFTANFAVVFNDSSSDRPVIHIDFEGPVTVAGGEVLVLDFGSEGLLTLISRANDA